MIIGYLPKEKTGRFAKIFKFSTFYKPLTNTCSLEIIGEAISQGDGKRMKAPYKLYFSAEDSFINILKQQLPKTIDIFSYLKQF